MNRLSLLAALALAAPTLAKTPAEGFGAAARGGEGGRVIRVTSLADDGAGSLREELAQSGQMIIEFAVEGAVELESRLRIRLKMSGDAARLVQEAGYRPVAMQIDECMDEEGTVEVRFESHAIEDILPWILRWGPYCKVLSPSALVKKVQTHVKRIAELYE